MQYQVPTPGKGWRVDPRDPDTTGSEEGCLCGKEEWQPHDSSACFVCAGCGGLLDFETVDRYNQERYSVWLDDHGELCPVCDGQVYDIESDSTCTRCGGHGAIVPTNRKGEAPPYPGDYINYGVMP